MGTCTAFLEVGKSSFCLSLCAAGKASAGHMLHVLCRLTAVSCPRLQGQAPAGHVLHSVDRGWLALFGNLELMAASCLHPEPIGCCAALQVWLGLFPMQTVMLAVICVSCALLRPQVDVNSRTLQVGDQGKARICVKP